MVAEDLDLGQPAVARSGSPDAMGRAPVAVSAFDRDAKIVSYGAQNGMKSHCNALTKRQVIKAEKVGNGAGLCKVWDAKHAALKLMRILGPIVFPLPALMAARDPQIADRCAV
jgi:hypothetical protein